MNMNSKHFLQQNLWCFILLTIFLLWLLNACAPTSQGSSQEWYEYYLNAQKASDAEEWEKAILLFKKAIAKDPQPEKQKSTYGMHYVDYFPYLELGQVYLAKGDIENALFYCEKAKQYGIAPNTEVEKCLATSLPRSIPRQIEKMKIAILDFTSAAESYQELAMAITERLHTKLIAHGAYNVLARGEDLEHALKELELQQSGIVDENTAVTVGKYLGAQFVIIGSVKRPGSKYQIDARMINVETGEGIIAASIEAQGEDELLNKVPELALKLTSGVKGIEEE